MSEKHSTRTRLQILWACAAINAVGAKVAWGTFMGGINLGIATATAVIAIWFWLDGYAARQADD